VSAAGGVSGSDYLKGILQEGTEEAEGRGGERQGGRKSGLNPPSLFELWLGTQKIAKVAKEDAGERDESCSGEECFI
jgi:hypothetical protein